MSHAPSSSSYSSASGHNGDSDGVAPLPVEPEMDRAVKDVPPVPLIPLGEEHIFDRNTGLPRLERLKEHFLKEGRLTTACAMRIIAEATALLKAEPNMLDLKYPITVCGDIHGQYFDLVRLFDVGGDPKDTQYLFLGDYVDRGCFSTEVVFYLYAHKLVYPKTLYMIRGNHECRQLTSFFNFKDECVYKYDLSIYDAIMDSFDQLPLGAIVNKTFFCVHGGLSPELSTLDEIRTLNRRQEIPREGAMCDLLWSDPFEEEGATDNDASDDAETSWFQYNETRQCSYLYGVEAVKQFLAENNVTSIIRAHEAQVDGYKMQMINRGTGIPRVITIFSAPNYCIAAGTKVTKADGTATRIEDVSPHTPTDLLSYSSSSTSSSVSSKKHEKEGCVMKPTYSPNVLNQGVKPCVEVLMEDGRTLTCTADHRIITANRGQVQAKDLVTSSNGTTHGTTHGTTTVDRVLMAPEGPLDDPADDTTEEKQWTVTLTSSSSPSSSPPFSSLPLLSRPLVFGNAADRERLLALARVLGIVSASMTATTPMATSTVVPIPTSLQFSHVLDVECLNKDIAKILGVPSLSSSPSSLTVSFNSIMQSILNHMFQQPMTTTTTSSSSSSSPSSSFSSHLRVAHSQLPTVLSTLSAATTDSASASAPALPKAFVREFLAAVFGSAQATAPTLASSSSPPSPPSSNGTGTDNNWTALQLTQASSTMSTSWMEAVRTMLLMFNIDSSFSISPTSTTSPQQQQQVTLLVSPSSTSAFVDSIGVRYNALRQRSLAVTASWYKALYARLAQAKSLLCRLQAKQQQQHQQDDLDVADVVKLAAADVEREMNTILLPGVVDAVAALLATHTTSAASAARLDEERMHAQSMYMTAEAFIKNVGADSFFAESSSSTSPSLSSSASFDPLPSWSLSVVGVRTLGHLPTYDLCVTDTSLFVANGVVVHNCDVYKNKAACLKFDHNILNIKQFVDSQHPYYLPNFMDVFQWSLPFVAEKVTDMLANIIDMEDEEDVDDEKKSTVVEARGGLLKKKVMAVTKLLRMYKVLRAETDAIVALKQLTPNHKVPAGLLAKGAEGIKKAINSFESAKNADMEFERRPDSVPHSSPKMMRRFSRAGSTVAAQDAARATALFRAGSLTTSGEGLSPLGVDGFGDASTSPTATSSGPNTPSSSSSSSSSPSADSRSPTHVEVSASVFSSNNNAGGQ